MGRFKRQAASVRFHLAGAGLHRNRSQDLLPTSLGRAEAQPIFNLVETLARLNERLNEPFVTVNTVTGDLGIKQAQDDYQRLMNNKSPKNKRK